MTKDGDLIEITEVDASGVNIYNSAKAQIDSQVATARAYPRNVGKSLNNALAIVTMDEETARTCTYSVPRGGKAITGASVHLARILLQTWGNIRAEARVIAIEPKHVVSEAVCWDLENNSAVKVEIKRSIMTRSGRMSDDMITVTGNAANAIALRNAVLAVIPAGITNKVYSAAVRKITGDISSEEKMNLKRRKVIDQFIADYEVTEEQVLALVGKSSANHITAQDITVLVGVWQAIRDGDSSADEIFNRVKTPKPDHNKVSKEKQLARLKEKLAETTDPDDLTILLETVSAHSEMKKLVEERIKELQDAKKDDNAK